MKPKGKVEWSKMTINVLFLSELIYLFFLSLISLFETVVNVHFICCVSPEVSLFGMFILNGLAIVELAHLGKMCPV